MFDESTFDELVGRRWPSITIKCEKKVKVEFRSKRYGGEVGNSIVSAYNGKSELEYVNNESITTSRAKDYFAIAYTEK